MTTDTVPQTVLFPDLLDKPLVATFDQPHASSDGGAVLLKAAERQYGVIEGFTQCLVDDRQAGKVRHTLAPTKTPSFLGHGLGENPISKEVGGKREPWLAHCVGVLLGSDRQAPTERVSV